MSRIGKQAFTLVEVMVAVAVLSLGIVMIYDAFFTNLDLFGYYSNYLKFAPWLDEKLWEAQDLLSRGGGMVTLDRDGDFVKSNKKFHWVLSCTSLDDKQGLYGITIRVSWQDGLRKANLTRNAYALYEQER